MFDPHHVASDGDFVPMLHLHERTLQHLGCLHDALAVQRYRGHAEQLVSDHTPCMCPVDVGARTWPCPTCDWGTQAQ